MNGDRELLASEQMRDRIADFLEEQARVRDMRSERDRELGVYPPRNSRLLFGMSCEVRRMPARPAQTKDCA